MGHCELLIENKTHSKKASSFEEAFKEIEERIVEKGNLSHVSIKRQLDLLNQLSQFPFGRYLIERRGANGFWTDFLLSYKREESLPCNSEAEEFILNRSLLVLAHRDRIRIFQQLVREQLRDGLTLASIPCGLMRDLITLDYSNVNNVKLVGIDIDPESLELANQFALKRGLADVEFHQQDAWRMEFRDEFDIITSSGLNVYEADPDKVLELYRLLYRALRPGGSLIISVLTHPPGGSKKTDWDLSIIPSEDLLMENILYKDILDLHWRNFRSSLELDVEFIKAGFQDIRVHFDRQRIFPTIHAKKP